MQRGIRKEKSSLIHQIPFIWSYKVSVNWLGNVIIAFVDAALVAVESYNKQGKYSYALGLNVSAKPTGLKLEDTTRFVYATWL